jgi:hypothetical protein
MFIFTAGTGNYIKDTTRFSSLIYQTWLISGHPTKPIGPAARDLSHEEKEETKLPRTNDVQKNADDHSTQPQV